MLGAGPCTQGKQRRQVHPKLSFCADRLHSYCLRSLFTFNQSLFLKCIHFNRHVIVQGQVGNQHSSVYMEENHKLK